MEALSAQPRIDVARFLCVAINGHPVASVSLSSAANSSPFLRCVLVSSEFSYTYIECTRTFADAEDKVGPPNGIISFHLSGQIQKLKGGKSPTWTLWVSLHKDVQFENHVSIMMEANVLLGRSNNNPRPYSGSLENSSVREAPSVSV